MTSGSGGPPLPMATITGRNPASRQMRAAIPAIAVLPVRLPVPMTATEGAAGLSERSGGVKEKSAPM